eukprot:923420-Alexandrium_andersonii.AAC.1
MGTGPSGGPAADRVERGGGGWRAGRPQSSALSAHPQWAEWRRHLRAEVPFRRLRGDALPGPRGAARHVARPSGQ